MREQKTINSSTRKIMTLADMRMANMSECRPHVATVDDLYCTVAYALTSGPSHHALHSPRSKIASIMAKGNPQPDPDCRPRKLESSPKHTAALHWCSSCVLSLACARSRATIRIRLLGHDGSLRGEE